MVSTLIKISVTIFFLFVWGILIFYPNTLALEFAVPNGLIFAIVFVVAYVSMKWFPFKKRIRKAWNEKLCLLIASVCLLGVELFISWNIVFRTSWDPGAVWYGSHYVAMNDMDGISTMSEYFSIYPNNLLLVFIYSVLLKANMLSGEIISNGVLLLVFFQCILLTLTGVLVFWCAKHYVSVGAAWAVYFLYVALAGLSGWMVIPYSDGTGIIFPVCLLALYLKMKETDWAGKKYILLFIIVCLGVIGYHIKPTSVIVLIAMAVVELTNWMKSSLENRRLMMLKRIGCIVLISVAALMFTLQVVSLLIDQMHFNINQERALGWQHHLMLGANNQTSGGFSEEDLDFSSSFDDRKTKETAELRVFRERIQEMGAKGYFRLSVRKAARSYLNGTFGWGGGDSFYTEIYPERSNPLCSILRAWYYDNKDGKLYRYHAFIRQILWFFVLITAPLVVITRRQYSDIEKVLLVSVMGLALYLQLFESHSRYLFIYVPFFCIMAVQGYLNINRIWKSRGKSHENTDAC